MIWDVKGYSELDKILDLSPDSIFAENDRSEDSGSLYADFVTLQEATQKQMDSPDSYEVDFSLTRQITSAVSHFVKRFGE